MKDVSETYNDATLFFMECDVLIILDNLRSSIQLCRLK